MESGHFTDPPPPTSIPAPNDWFNHRIQSSCWLQVKEWAYDPILSGWIREIFTYGCVSVEFMVSMGFQKKKEKPSEMEFHVQVIS